MATTKTATTMSYAEELEIIKTAKQEQMGLNCALKCLRQTKGFKGLCAKRGFDESIFKDGKSFVEFVRTHLPEAFNEEGALCRFVTNKETKETTLVPRTTYTPHAVYTLAKKCIKKSAK